MNYIAIIKEVGRGIKGAADLDQDTACELYCAMLDGKVPQLELGALLIAFRIKGESEQEMLGFHQALAGHVNPIARPAGKPLPVLLPAYNGARKLANLLPLLAMLLQKHGVPVLLHGVTQDPRWVTAAETLALLDVPISTTAQEAEVQLAQKGIAFLTAHGLSLAMVPSLNCAGGLAW